LLHRESFQNIDWESFKPETLNSGAKYRASGKRYPSANAIPVTEQDAHRKLIIAWDSYKVKKPGEKY
jgi:hypothetical protein